MLNICALNFVLAPHLVEGRCKLFSEVCLCVTNGWTDRQMDRQTDRQTNGQTDRQMDRQKDRKTDI